MADRVDRETRSRNMSKVSGKDTKTEIAVRKILWKLGYRYRLHVPNLPGKPDIVFPGRKKVIFVNGCFWHCHENCKRATMPKTNIDFWEQKLERNAERDKENINDLRTKGWKALVVWECEVKQVESLKNRLIKFLND